MNRTAVPDRTEAAEYYFRYIEQVAPGDICDALEAQGTEVLALLREVTEERSWRSHMEEFAAVRAATLALFRNLPAEAWSRRGTASDNPFTVRALAYVVAGHATHHLRIVREKYLVPAR